MNLWLRLLWMLLTAPFRKRVTIFDTTTLHMRVWPNDLDFNGHVNNGRYLTLADIGRMDFTLRSGTARIAFEQRALPIVGDAIAKFRKDLKPFQRYELRTRVLGWDDKWIFMEHQFVTGGRVAGTVIIRGLFRAADGPVHPQVLLAGLGLTASSPPLPQWLVAWNQSCEGLSAQLRLEEGAHLALRRTA